MEGRKRVVVLGGGLAGLRGAVRLLEDGHDVEIIEKLGSAGGLGRSHTIDGFVFDHGPHGFFARDEWLIDEFKDLMGGEENYVWLTKWSQIRYRGEYFNYPLKMRDLASKLSVFTLLRSFFSYLWSRARLFVTRREPGNAEQYLIDQFGQVLYEQFFGPYTRKVWGIDPSEIDADFTRDRVPSLHLWEVLRNLFVDPVKQQQKSRLTPSGRVATHDQHTFYYPREGAGALPDAYVEWVLRLGGRIRYDSMATRIDRDAKVIEGVSDGVPFELPYDALLSTIPLDTLSGLLDPAPPEHISTSAESLRYRGILLVNICVAKPQVIGPFWIYYTNRTFNRISEYRHFSPDLAPEGKTGICLEIGCDPGDELWDADDATIIDHCLPDLEDLGLLERSDILGQFVIREPLAYPIYDVGYKSRINEIVSWFEHDAHVMTAGRQGRFLYINQDAALISGLDAAKAIDKLLKTGVVEERVVWDNRPRRKIVK